MFLNKEYCKIIDFASLIGKVVAACPAVKYGWLYTKLIEREKLLALSRAKNNYKKLMYISNQAKADIKWWIKAIPQSGLSFRQAPFSKEIFTDASDLGWGATDGRHSRFGRWSRTKIAYHINFKELLAVNLALENLASGLSDCSLLLRIDNSTAIAYVNKMGGVRFEKFNNLAKVIWQWAEARNIWLKASYIPSRENTEADRLSRLINPDAEWEISQTAFTQIVNILGVPEIDIFASALNKKCKEYFSWLPDPEALEIDAFTVSWGNIFFYAFSPFILITKVLNKIMQKKATGILVVPEWFGQPWYPLFDKLVIGKPIDLGPNPELLISVYREKEHPRSASLRLIAAIVSGRLS